MKTSNLVIPLAAMLSPCPGEAGRAMIQPLLQDPDTDWGQLLYTANLHLCTPLWYSRLRQHGWLDQLPEELQHYLAALHDESRERNRLLQQGLIEILDCLDQHNIPSLLLKGAATFADNLYPDPGDRVMGDLDLLVPNQQAQKARELLYGLGYLDLFDPDNPKPAQPVDDRHHHIERIFKPDTPLVIEIHFTVGGGQAGRLLSADTAWKNAIPAEIPARANTVGWAKHSVPITTSDNPAPQTDENTAALKNDHNNVPIKPTPKAQLLAPTQRLIHNTAHALLPSKAFIRAELDLRQLAEFAALAHRYHNDIDWPNWLAAGKSQHADHAFITWLLLAHQIMDLPWPEALPHPSRRHHWHARRLLNQAALDATQSDPDTETRATSRTTRFYFHLQQPIWIWRNVHYSPGPIGLAKRLGFYIKKVLTGVNWKQFKA